MPVNIACKEAKLKISKIYLFEYGLDFWDFINMRAIIIPMIPIEIQYTLSAWG
jgi:hypothetical protein